MSRFARRLSNGLTSLKQRSRSDSQSSNSPTSSESTTQLPRSRSDTTSVPFPLGSPAPLETLSTGAATPSIHNLPHLAPEIWLQIVDLLPLEAIWPLRRTNRLFNAVAIYKAWQVFCTTEVGVRTYFDSEHEPLSHLSPSPEILTPIIPPVLSDLERDLRKEGKAIDDPFFRKTKRVTWTVKQELRSDCDDLRFTYRPFSIEITFSPTSVRRLRAGYKLEKPAHTKVPLQDFIKKEIWSVTEGKRGRKNSSASKSKFKLFRRGSGQKGFGAQWPVYKGAPLQWGLSYVGEYGLGINDNGNLAHQLDKLILKEVSLPVGQVVCALIDALKYEFPIEEEEVQES